MTPQIKQRIEQIRRSEVPEGYKKTKIGIVPEEWEETKFKKMFSRLNRKNIENNDNALTISAQYGLISQSEFFNKSIASEDKSNYFLLYKGEYAYNKSYSSGYPFGALKRLDKYEKGIVSPLYICFSATKDNACPEYYSHYFEGGLMNREIKAFAQEGARNHGLLNISVDDFFNTSLAFPPLAEQQKIVKILSTQDKLIELQQRKIAELQKLKKIYLNKMFPKKGEKVPEWRFNGFTDTWEQRKLGEVADKAVDNRGKTPPISAEGTHPLIEVACLGNGSPDYSKVEKYLDDNTFNTALRDYIKQDDILFSTVGSIGLVSLMDNKENAAIAQNIVAFRAKENYDASFLYAMFSTEENQDKAMRIVMGAVQPSIKVSQLINVEYSITPNKEEQRLLGQYFLNLDRLITLHQRKLEEMKKQKKSLMQLLLTGIVRCKQ